MNKKALIELLQRRLDACIAKCNAQETTIAEQAQLLADCRRFVIDNGAPMNHGISRSGLIDRMNDLAVPRAPWE